MSDPFPFNTVILGRLSQETIINSKNEVFIDKPGGNLLYTAYGYHLWGSHAGLISRIGQNFPKDWIFGIEQKGFDITGITRAPGDIDARRFYAIQEGQIRIDNPQFYFNDLSLPFPKELLGYSSDQTRLDNRKAGSLFTISPEDIPADYFAARFLLVCPLDFKTHSLVPAFFRSKSGCEVIFHPSRSYLNSSFYHDFPPIIRGATAVIASEQNLLELFLGKSEDIWEIAETIADFGVEIVVVTRENKGYLLFNSRKQNRTIIPAYPSQLIDPIGADNAFCGGFLAGYTNHFEPVRAAQMGSVTASIKIQGSTAEFLLGTLPELALARLEVIQDQTTVC